MRMDIDGGLPNHVRFYRLVRVFLEGWLFKVAFFITLSQTLFVYNLCALVCLPLALLIHLFSLSFKKNKILKSSFPAVLGSRKELKDR